MPAWALTISASAQKLTPSPYGSERPCRHEIRSGSASTIRESSYRSRDLPIPGTPTRVTSCGESSSRTRCSASRTMSSSRARPTSSVLASCGTSTPKCASASNASQTGTGAFFPLASTGAASRYAITPRVAR